MKIEDSKNNQINSIEDWRKIQPKAKWKAGRSAFELAKFVIEDHGVKYISDIVNKLLDKEAILEYATPECNVNFDKFRSGRKHDLGIWGKVFDENVTKKVFIGIEAKVDEPFDCRTIKDAYIEGIIGQLNQKESNLPERITGLLKRFSKKISKKHFNLRYQLLFSLAGTIDAKADIHIFMILVFKTPLYDKKKGDINKKDYQIFMSNINAEQKLLTKKEKCYKTNIKNKEGIEKDIYSVYAIINNRQ